MTATLLDFIEEVQELAAHGTVGDTASCRFGVFGIPHIYEAELIASSPSPELDFYIHRGVIHEEDTTADTMVRRRTYRIRPGQDAHTRHYCTEALYGYFDNFRSRTFGTGATSNEAMLDTLRVFGIERGET